MEKRLKQARRKMAHHWKRLCQQPEFMVSMVAFGFVGSMVFSCFVIGK